MGLQSKSRQEIIGIKQKMVTWRQFLSHENASCFPQPLPDSPQANQISELLNISTPALEVSQGQSQRPSHTPLAPGVIYPALCSLMLPLFCIGPHNVWQKKSSLNIHL